jgi:hypothetical protein
MVYASGSAYGDPYVTPIHGLPYKLPDLDSTYRLAQAPGFVLNGQVRRCPLIERQIRAKAERFNSTKTIELPAEHFFFSKLFLQTSTSPSMIIDLETHEMYEDATNQRVAFGTTRGTVQISMPRSATMCLQDGVTHVPVLSFTISTYFPESKKTLVCTIMYSKNPQIRNGVDLSYDGTDMDGILVRRYRAKLWTIGKLNDTKWKTFCSERPLTKKALPIEHTVLIH